MIVLDSGVGLGDRLGRSQDPAAADRALAAGTAQMVRNLSAGGAAADDANRQLTWRMQAGLPRDYVLGVARDIGVSIPGVNVAASAPTRRSMLPYAIGAVVLVLGGVGLWLTRKPKRA